MGQAKSRGTFEQRKAAAIIRDKEMAEERKRQRQERDDALTPAQKRKQAEAYMTLLALSGMGPFPYVR